MARQLRHNIEGGWYHLLIETPRANASRALQWLNVSYKAGFLPKEPSREQVQATAILILTSVRVAPDPPVPQTTDFAGEGRVPPRPAVSGKAKIRIAVQARLAKLRGHVWSSYPAYAGYSAKPEWLTCERLWRRAGTGKGKEGGKADYRRYLEDCLRQAVEAVKGEEWASFADRKGDYGRDLALYVARMNCGLSIPELAALAGTEPAAASKAIQRMRKRLSGDRKLKLILRRVSAETGVRVS